MVKDSRTKLIEAATRLFAEKGFVEVSIRELAKEAKVNSALIAYYFGGKDGLYQAVVEEYFHRIEERISETVMTAQDPLEKLRAFVTNLSALHREMPYLRKYITREFIKPTPVMAVVINKYISRFYMLISGILQEAVEQKKIRPDIDLQFIPITIAGMIHFYYMADKMIGEMSSIFPEILDEKKFSEQIQEIVLNGILLNRGNESHHRN